MKLPPKALRFGQLKMKTAGHAVPASGHEVFRATFTDSDGVEKTGFYKPLGETYPKLLALYSVASSIVMRASLGERVADDRLVFNDDNEIIGTFSVALPDFKPLLCTNESLPADAQERNKVYPSIDALLHHNVAELLAVLWWIKDDDGHPGNFSLSGLIDPDMRLYHLTWILKGLRKTDGIVKGLPEDTLPLKSRDIDNFPILPGRAAHWPANEHPGNLNYLKRYMSYENFQALASNPSLRTEEGIVYFQEQLFHAFLKMLLTFDPDMLRSRFIEYFGLSYDLCLLSEDKPLEPEKLYLKEIGGKIAYSVLTLDGKVARDVSLENIDAPTPFTLENLLPLKEIILEAAFQNGHTRPDMLTTPLDFLSLPEEKRDQLSQKDATLFNTETNAQPFVNHLMVFFQKEYDELYRTVVFYRGCEVNQKGAVVPSFNRYLRCKPSSFELINKWVLHQNAPENNRWALKESQYNQERLNERYHQIWRDSNIEYLRSPLLRAKNLADSLANELRITQGIKCKSVSPSTEDTEITQAWQLFWPVSGELPVTDCDPKNCLKIALDLLCKYIGEIEKSSLDYYQLPRTKLTDHRSITFCDGIYQICSEYEKQIWTNLTGTKWIKEFMQINQALHECRLKLSFFNHIFEKDLPIHDIDKSVTIAPLVRQHTDQDIITEALEVLFNWARDAQKSVFEAAVTNIITIKYEKSGGWWTDRGRVEPVNTYLKANLGDPGDDILAYIFSTGGTETTSLNTRLIEALMPLALEASLRDPSVNLCSVKIAIDNGKFKAPTYANAASVYAKTNKRFNHIFSETSVMRFNAMMYNYVDSLEHTKFNKLITDIVSKYKPYGINIFSNKTRDTRKIEQTLKKGWANSKVLASILSEGGYDSTSLNTRLFKKLLVDMQTNLGARASRGCSAAQGEDYALLAKIHPEVPEIFERYKGSLEGYAKAPKANARAATSTSTISSYSCPALI